MHISAPQFLDRKERKKSISCQLKLVGGFKNLWVGLLEKIFKIKRDAEEIQSGDGLFPS